MRIRKWVIVLLVCWLTACRGDGVPNQPYSELGEGTPTGDVRSQGGALPNLQGDLFTTSGNCALCHNGLQDEAGSDVSIADTWRSTMMANAARDPYWQASVQHEVAVNPEIGAAIEDKCAVCHMPMGTKTVHAEGGQGLVLDSGFSDGEHPMHLLAMDGVSCTVCHQVLEDGLGTQAAFSGAFQIDTETEMGQRVIYGPFAVQDSLNELMRSASGFNSEETQHMAQAALCGSCHTLYTEYVDLESGALSGRMFPEQTPFLEWSHSAYPGERVCQDCHMPLAVGDVQISTAGGSPRPGFSQHEFVGGNTYVLGMLRDNVDDLGATASSEQFEQKREQAQRQVQENAAVISIEELEFDRGFIRFDVLVEALTGHKFPGGFPSRRAWLNVIVTDGNGDIVFNSGSWQEDGLIIGSDYDASSSGYEPHYDLITSADQVQVYQPIIKNSQGELSTILLHAAGYLKDNRLLPAGFDKDTAGEEISVQGEAATDDDFVGGSDRVTYEITIDEVIYPLKIEVSLLYQSISYRWAMNLIDGSGPMIDRFAGYYEELDNNPIVVDTMQVDVAE